MAAGMVKHGKRHAACVLLLMALWYHPAFSKERNLPVIPYPAEVRMDGRGVYDMERSSWWIDPEADSLCVKAVERFFAGVAHDGPSRVRDREDASVLFLDDRDLPQGHYAIDVSEDGITVKSSGLHGLNYACQTLRQMYPDIPCCRIRDFPRFRYRGMHLDVSRHFFSVREVKRYIDIMELHKMNILHWHLTDDQGWRVEIRKYPLLTEKGAFRKGTCIGDDLYSDDGIPYGGFYTQDEIREVVSYAAERGISVMPEIDMPGHMLASLASYPWLGCTGGTLILSEAAPFDAPTFIYYMVILYSVLNPLKEFSRAGYNIPKGLASMERVDKILKAENEKYRPIISRESIMPDTPQYTSFFLPTLSIMNTAITVVAMFTAPTSTWENMESPLERPACSKMVGP